MPRRLLAIVALLTLQGGPLLALARPLLQDIAHDCRCTERLCHCPHKHRPPKKPDCHFPGGQAPDQLSFQSCDEEAAGAVQARPWILPSLLSAQPAEGIAFEIPPSLPLIHSSHPGPDPPPPRFLPPSYS